MSDIQITVQLNDRASRQLQNIDRAANSLTTSLRGAGAAVAAFASGSVVRGVISQYTAFERYRTVLTTFLGSQQKANAELQRLQGLANNLPQDLQDITEAFTILSRNGIDTGSEALTAFSNIATANGKSFTQLGEAVADALTGEFERLKEFGIKVSKENGKFVARIGQDQVAVANSSTDLVRQLQALGEEGGRFGGAAAANADTLGQSFSNLQGAIFEASITIGEQLKPALKDAVELTTTLIRNNKGLQETIGAGLGDAVRGTAIAMQLVADNIELVRNAALTYLSLRFANAFVNLATKMSSAVKATQSLGGMFATMGRSAATSIGSITGLGSVMRGVGAIATRLGPLLTNPFTAIPALVAAAVTGGLYYFRDSMIDLGSTSASVGEIVAASWWGLTEIFTGVAQWLVDKMSYAFNTIAGGLGTVYNYFSERFGGVLTVVTNVVNKMIGIVWGFFQTIWNNLQNLPAFFAQSLSSALSVIGSFASAAGSQFKEIWDYIASGGEDAIENTFSGLGDTIAAEVSKIGSTITPVDWNAALGTDYIGAASDYVTDKVGTMVTSIGGAVQGATADLVENYRAHIAATEAGKYYEDRIIRIANTQNAATGAVEETTNALNDLATTATGPAADAVETFAEKMNGAIMGLSGSISGTLTDVFLGLKDGFEGLQDIALSVVKTIVNTLVEEFLVKPLLTNISRAISGAFGGAGGGGIGSAALGLAGAGGGAFGGLGLATLIPGFGLLAGIGMLLGGMFADGGNVPSGKKPIVVGEKGPELFLPGRSGQVVPNDQLNNMGGGEQLVVNFNLSAIDTQTGTQFLIENKRVITGVIQEAYRRRGTPGPLG